jgi:hypothetical protein
MPFKLVKNPDGTYGVKNTETGKMTAKNTSLKNAKAQMRLLYSIVKKEK